MILNQNTQKITENKTIKYSYCEKDFSFYILSELNNALIHTYFPVAKIKKKMYSRSIYQKFQ